MNIKYIFGLCALAASTCAMTSCSDDNYDVVAESSDNLVYVNIAHDYPAGMPKNTYAFEVYHTPVGSMLAKDIDDVYAYVKTTKVPSSDVTVTFEVDPESELGTGYFNVPNEYGLRVSLDKATVTVKAGTNKSDSIKVNVDASAVDWSKFSEAGYLIPIRIAGVNGATASVDMPVLYVGVKTEVKNGMINPDADGVEGSIVNATDDWRAWAEVPATGAKRDNLTGLFDNNRGSYGYFFANHADRVNEEVITTLDMGKVYKIKGVMYRFYYYWYTVKDGKLETSTDGVEWTDQGTLSWDDYYMERPFAFWGPMDVRYIRLTSHSYYGGTGEGTALSDIVVYE